MSYEAVLIIVEPILNELLGGLDKEADRIGRTH